MKKFFIIAAALALWSGPALAGEKAVALDLHSHSICSDGIYTPEYLVDLAKTDTLRYYALSDHDTVACVARAQAQAKKDGITLVPAIEVSAEDDRMHILGLNLNLESPAIARLEKWADRARRARLPAIVAALEKAGVKLDAKNDVVIPKINAQRKADGKQPLSDSEAAALTLDQAQSMLAGHITRPDIAAALLARGYVSSKREAFDKYIGDDCPGYAEFQGPHFRDVIHAIHEAGAIAILAHPYTIYKGRKPPLVYSDKDYQSFQEIANDLLDAGLDGFEAFRPGWESEMDDFRLLEKVAAEYKGKKTVLFSAGSDFHGPGVTSVKGLYTEGLPVKYAKPLLKALKLD